MKKYAIIGCGHFGSEFARAIQESGRGEVVTAYSPSTGCEVLSEEIGCNYTHNLDDIWQDDSIDAVIIASPNYLHHQHVLAAASAKKNIFCEKPFALTIEQAQEMIAACKKAGVVMMVGHIMHFYDGLRHVKDMITDGKFGKVLTIHVERTGWAGAGTGQSWKKMQQQSGGHLFHHIHEIDLMQWFLGLPTEIYAVGGNLAHAGDKFADEDDVILITLSYGEGTFATMQYGSGFRMSNHIIRINGTAKGALINFADASVTIKDDNETVVLPLFNDKDCQDSILGLFKKADAGIIHGKAGTRPVQYIQTNLKAELSVFMDAVEGLTIDKKYSDLLDGTSALNSVIIAKKCTDSLNSKVVLTHGDSAPE